MLPIADFTSYEVSSENMNQYIHNRIHRKVQGEQMLYSFHYAVVDVSVSVWNTLWLIVTSLGIIYKYNTDLNNFLPYITALREFHNGFESNLGWFVFATTICMDTTQRRNQPSKVMAVF